MRRAFLLLSLFTAACTTSGPQGEAGATGPTGASGAPGAAGAMGATGPAGARGETGPMGITGAQGVTGPAGEVGAAGPTGPTGPMGPQGVPGVAGVTGPMGPAGATGAAGATGPAGTTGPTGAMGPTGPTGPAGVVDYSRVIANGTALQTGASFNVSGAGGVGTDLSVGGSLSVTGNARVSGTLSSPGSVVQEVVRTSTVTSSLNTATFTEANADYRVTLTPRLPNSTFLVEFTFSINTAMAPNTVHHMQVVRDIGGTEVPVGVGPANGLRQRTSWVGRPGNGYDGNDLTTVRLVAVDSGLDVGTPHSWGFKFRREENGSGVCHFNASAGDSAVYGFSGVMVMRVTEIAQ